MMPTTIVGIAGASGSGKSHFANRLLDRLSSNNVCVDLIQQDSYYHDQSDKPIEQRDLTNYDHPDAFEHDLMVKHLQQIRGGQTVEIPRYDYAVHNRQQETRTIASGISVLIVEGILLFHDSNVRNLLDVQVFVQTTLELCLERRIERDTLQRGRSEDSVRQQFETSVRPMFHQFIEPTQQYADLIVPGNGDQEVALEIVSKFLLP